VNNDNFFYNEEKNNNANNDDKIENDATDFTIENFNENMTTFDLYKMIADIYKTNKKMVFDNKKMVFDLTCRVEKLEEEENLINSFLVVKTVRQIISK
jgi:hypothetical protein